MDSSLLKKLGCIAFAALALGLLLLMPFLGSSSQIKMLLETKSLTVAPGEIFDVSIHLIGAIEKDRSAVDFRPDGPKGGPRWAFDDRSSDGRFLGGNALSVRFLAPTRPGKYTITAKFPGWFGDKKQVQLLVSHQGMVSGPALGLVNPSVSPDGKLKMEWAQGAYLEGASVTLLQDGSVLIAGGLDPSDPRQAVSKAIRYWPLESRAISLDSMVAPRKGHDALLLVDGKVLLLGAENPGSAECFDPASNRFERLPEIPLGGAPSSLDAYKEHRPILRAHPALLPDGRVLIYPYQEVPPIFPDQVIEPPRAFLWDPASKALRALGPVRALRENPTLSRMKDGRILVVGAPIDPKDPNREKAPDASAMTEIYVPDQEAFLPGPSLIRARRAHRAVELPNGAIVLVGGWSARWSSPGGSGFTPCPRIEILEAHQSQFREGESIPGSPTVLLAMKDGSLLMGYNSQLHQLSLGPNSNGSLVPIASKYNLPKAMALLQDGRVLLLNPQASWTGLLYP